MKNSIAYFVIALWCPFQCILGQSQSLDQKVSTSDQLAKVKELALVSSNFVGTDSQVNASFFNNEVQLQQIGNHNTFNAKLQVKSGNVSVLQKGNSNSITLDKVANSIQQKFIQIGNNNTVYDYGNQGRLDLKSEFIQKGNNQTINSYGSNSISKDLKISQFGNGASVIVINN